MTFASTLATYMTAIRTSLYVTSPTATSAPTTVAAGLFSPETLTAAVTNKVYWSIGYYYQSGFDLVKAGCLTDPACDWNTWTGYDGMLFVVNF